MSNHRRTSILLALLAATLTGACAGGASHGAARAPAPTLADADSGEVETSTAALMVTNEHPVDVEIVVQSGGMQMRLGNVVSLTSQRFTLPRGLYPTGELEIVARAIGTNVRATSGNLLVSPGQTIRFTVRSLLIQSSATVY